MLFLASRGLPVVIELGLLVFAFIDCIQTPAEEQRNLPKPVWIVLILIVPLLGSIAWLVAGRPRARREPSVPWPSTSTAGFPEYERPRRGRGQLAPDDDPEFLAGLAAGREDEQRLKAWEENLRRREEDLKRTQGPGPTDGAGPAGPGGPQGPSGA